MRYFNQMLPPNRLYLAYLFIICIQYHLIHLQLHHLLRHRHSALGCYHQLLRLGAFERYRYRRRHLHAAHPYFITFAVAIVGFAIARISSAA